ncbi:MAG: LuxR family transcriptional regulator [Oscillochloris sp.]|nr:LuxR family transcriptional regulator [Oscillochloris sp.]
MAIPVIATKLLVPPLRLNALKRSRLIRRLQHGSAQRLSLLSAPAGFGKTTLLSSWLVEAQRPIAWLALDAADSEPVRLLVHLVAALRSIVPAFGANLEALLQSPQPPPITTLVPALLNELTAIPESYILVLDDYHLVEAADVDQFLATLLDHMPPHLHLVISTREDPNLPLARLRACGQLSELRAADLRFTADEAAGFLRQVMGLSLTTHDIAALEQRTEGWIAGLQLAALSLQGHADPTGFVAAFSGSHRFVLDYLLEEVLHRRPAAIQDFLLCTAILDRLCGPLCEALLEQPDGSGQATLEMLDRANLFLVPLDHERGWYRYHHLFRDLLRKRLQQAVPAAIPDLHLRASVWYEAAGFDLEAFQHAAAANTIARAEHLISGRGVPLYLRGATRPVLTWLAALPPEVRDAHPSLWVHYAWCLMAAHRSTQVEAALQAAEAALAPLESDVGTRDLCGQIAAIRAMEAAIQYQAGIIIAQAQRALELLHPDNGYVRTAVTRSLAIAYQFRGERAAARKTYYQAIAMSEGSNNRFINILATTGLGMIQASDNQLAQAAQSYQRVLDLVADPNQPIACAAYLGLARIHCEWNELETAQEYGRHGVHLARQIESIDSAASGEIFLAQLKLIQGDVAGAAAMLAAVGQVIYRRGFAKQKPVLAAAQVLVALRLGDLQQAEQVAHRFDLPLSRARVALAQEQAVEALKVLAAYRRQMEANHWPDEQLKALVLQALAHHQSGAIDAATTTIGAALALAAPGGFVRTFLDEGRPMADLLVRVRSNDERQEEYRQRLVAAFGDLPDRHPASSPNPLLDPLSPRELEVLQLVSQGFSNREISERLFVALDTVKGHNRRIYEKLQVQRRTEAVARARALGLLDTDNH